MTKLQGRKVLMIVSPVNFRDEELLHTREILEAEGAEVKVAAKEKRLCRGMLGASVTPDLTVREAKAADFDVVIVVGGSGSPQNLWTDNELVRLVRDAKMTNKIVCSICLGGVVLAKAGALKGIEATVFPTRDSLKELQAGGARYVQRSVVASGKVITAEGPDSAKEFGKKIVDVMATLR